MCEWCVGLSSSSFRLTESNLGAFRLGEKERGFHQFLCLGKQFLSSQSPSLELSIFSNKFFTESKHFTIHTIVRLCDFFTSHSI